MTSQKQFVLNLSRRNPDAVIIGSLGTISKDLVESGHKNVIPVKGAMGCVLGVGLGYAMNSDKKVIVLIGDGAFLMKMGSVATILHHKQKNLSIYIINNNRYESCGGQETYFKDIEKYLPPSIYVKNMV